MVNIKLIDYLQAQTDEPLLFYDNLEFDNAIIGITNDNRVAYVFSKMIEETMLQLDCDYTRAVEMVRI